MSDAFRKQLTQEIADLVGHPINGIGPGKPGRIRFTHTHALPQVVDAARRLLVEAGMCSLSHPTEIRHRIRVLELLLRWYDHFLTTSGRSTPSATFKAMKAGNVLRDHPELLEDDSITFDDLLARHGADAQPLTSGYQSLGPLDREERFPPKPVPLPTRPVLWRSKRYRLEELTHPTHVLVEGKALRHGLCTRYSQAWLDHAKRPPGACQSAHCLTAWRMIEQQDLRLFSLVGRQGPLLTIPLITSHNALGVMVGREGATPDGNDDVTPALIDALRALDDAIGPLFLSETALNPGLFARITAELPQLKATRHYAIDAKITIRNPPPDA